MTDDQPPFPGQNPAAGGNEPYSQEIQHSQVGAIVPERVARGAFSTGAVVLNGTHEFIIDFLLRMTKPHQVAARVILPPAVVPRLIAALRENIENYKKKFGPPASPQLTPEAQAAQANQATKTTPQELYEQLKLADDVISGTYANAVMIGHTATEFSFDFITSFFPRSAVSCRVYLAAPNVPRFLESLTHSFEQFQRKIAQQQQQTPPPSPPPESKPPEPEF